MLAYSYRLLRTNEIGSGFKRNALIESCLIHARNLYWLMYDDEPQHRDTYAGDYFVVAETWILGRPPETESMTSAKSAIDKRVAHISYTSGGVQDVKDWGEMIFVPDLVQALTSFRLLAKDQKGLDWRWFDSGLSLVEDEMLMVQIWLSKPVA